MAKGGGFVLGEEWPDWWADAVAVSVVTTHNNDDRWRGGPDFALIHTPSAEPTRIEGGEWVDKKLIMA